VQPPRALVGLEAEVQAVQVRAQLVPVSPPVTVTYELTERGRALMPAPDQIAQWARDNLPPDRC
jgi:DNA-binding HxlR family transcriptional regulator